MRNGGGGIRLIDQDVSPDDHIKVAGPVEIEEIGLNEFNFCAAPLKTRSLAGLFNHNGIAIDARHMAHGSNQSGCEQRDIADSTAQVEHPHAGLETGRKQKLFGPFFEERCLEPQALLFLRAIAQNVAFDGSAHGARFPANASGNTENLNLVF
jgi:hypothetical protein